MDANSASAPSPASCCAQSERASQTPCSGCGRPVCRFCGNLRAGGVVCAVCAGAPSRAAAAGGLPIGLPIGIAVGAAAAIVAGLVWAGIAIGANAEIGYVAIGVGWITGLGVVKGSGGTRGGPVQIAAVGCAVFGLLVGKYIIVAHAVKQFIGQQDPAAGQAIGYLSGSLISFFFGNIGEFLSPWDALWAFLALGAAWKVAGEDAAG